MVKKYLLIIFAPILIFLLALGGYTGYSIYKINHIPKFTIKPATIYKKTFNIDKNMISYLIFSTGSKGLNEGDGDRLNIGRYRAKMGDGLTDSIMLVLTNPQNREIAVLSIPRDTYLLEKGRRINASYNTGGVNLLLDDVELLTGIRANHAISMNFAAFSDLVDTVGGIDINIPTYVEDKEAHLSITQKGCVHLDGPTALAFARSRHYRVSDDGINFRNDASSSDWGRIERQQSILRIVAGKILNPSIITLIPSLFTVAQNNITLDSNLNFNQLLSIGGAWRDGVAHIYAATYPGVGKTLPESGAQVILPNVEEGQLLAFNLSNKIGFASTYNPALVESHTVSVDKNGNLINKSESQTAGITQNSGQVSTFISERSINGNGGTYYSSCIN